MTASNKKNIKNGSKVKSAPITANVAVLRLPDVVAKPSSYTDHMFHSKNNK